MIKASRWLCLILAAGTISCSKGPEQVKVYPVKGQVVCAGMPATHAFVIFHPSGETDELAKTLRPHGRVGEDGYFELTTYVDADGAPEGNYSVTITWPAGEGPNAAIDPEMAASGEDRLLGQYADPGITTLEATVGPQENDIPAFEVELPKQRRSFSN